MKKVLKITDITNLVGYVILCIILGLSYNNPDYKIYKADYDNGWYLFEKLFNYSMIMGKKLNLTYAMYIFVWVVICAWVLKKAFDKIMTNHLVVLFAILLAPGGLLVTQIRSLFAYFFLYYLFVSFLSEDKNIKKDILYIIGIIVLIGVHKTMVFYLLFVPVKYLKINKIAIFTGFCVALNMIILKNNKLIYIIGEFLGKYTHKDKINVYLFNGTRPSYIGLLASYILYFLGLLAIFFVVYEEYIKNCEKNSFYSYINKTNSLAIIFLKCYFWLAILLPFINLGTIYERLYYYMYPFIYALIYRQIEISETRIQKINLTIVLFVLVLYAFFYMVYVNGVFDTIFLPLFVDNYIWNIII